MNNLLKRVASSLLLGSLWLVPMARATAAETRAPVAVNEPAPVAPEPSTFADLFPFGAVASAGALGQLQTSDDSAYAAREQQATALQDFRGGAVYVYLGSTALLVAIIILIVLLV